MSLFIEDERLERIEREKKARAKNKVLLPGEEVLPPPRLSISPVTQIFEGSALNEVHCQGCQRVSRTIENFTDLSVSIPTRKLRVKFREQQRLRQESRRSSPYNQEGGGGGGGRSISTPPSPAQFQSPRSRRKEEQGGNRLIEVSGAPPASGETVVEMGHVAKQHQQGWFSSLFTGVWGVVSRFMHWIRRTSPFGDIDLEECLGVYCMEDQLNGSNKYKCAHCGSLQDASKRTAFLELPEILCIQLKRFCFNSYWTSKISDYVAFPMEWDPKSVPPSLLPFSREGDYDEAGGPPLVLDLAGHCANIEGIGPPPLTTYSLFSVINHHGGFHGGHYTNFSLKRGKWFQFNDERVCQVRADQVGGSQGYMLFYQKQRPAGGAAGAGGGAAASPGSTRSHHHQRLGESEQARPPPEVPWGGLVNSKAKAHRYLAQPKEIDWRAIPSDDCVYISRQWLHRLMMLEEPGLILNEMCYCDEYLCNRWRRLFDNDEVASLSRLCEGGQGKMAMDRCPQSLSSLRTQPIPTPKDKENPPRTIPHLHTTVDHFYTQILRQDWAAWVAHFGGGPIVTVETYERLLSLEKQAEQGLKRGTPPTGPRRERGAEPQQRPRSHPRG